ncbi:TPA: hypothetical protein I7665_03290 [Vibrio vulnificus]|uniref:hypothetical protein n=1 Tax=Vibrio vulnificus TaxID=672 RepID=UPI0010299661|nr:hypothetical protein [Vibrio vulnificus]EHZ7120942.1 hypothetical protein [Vibrio vulnificus]EIO3971231.1 hypothetical protein [Vibrio vulnificus]EKO5189127.1 hypothetical protein [Vibrio vulnificus]EKO5198675.1 hypothetical protein [Vibrio vulnificus]ELO5514289.1 hypothetical protein [Vibrio vulnificus]
MDFYSLDERAIKREIDYKNEEISKADVVFSWSCTNKRSFEDKFFEIFILAFMPSLLLFLDSDIYLFSFVLVMSILMALYFRFTLHQPRLFYYELTKVGVRYTVEENVHEFFYKFSSAGGVVIIAVSMLAMIFVGPAALAGVGAGLLHAKIMSNHRKLKEYKTYILPNSFHIRYHRARQEVAINPRYEKEMMSIGIYSFGTREDIHISPDKLYQLLFYLKKEFDVIDIKEAKTHKELNREYLN